VMWDVTARGGAHTRTHTSHTPIHTLISEFAGDFMHLPFCGRLRGSASLGIELEKVWVRIHV